MFNVANDWHIIKSDTLWDISVLLLTQLKDDMALFSVKPIR